MVRKALILLPIALTLMGARGCQTIEQRASEAAAAKGEAQASIPFPDLPPACTAKMERVRPKPGEPRVITLKRWDVVANNRDQQAEDCRAWGQDLKRESLSSRSSP